MSAGVLPHDPTTPHQSGQNGQNGQIGQKARKSTPRRAAPRLPASLLLPALSVIIPTLNEAQNIGALLRRLHETMRQHGILYEVIIVDDHSSDATIAVAEQTAQALGAPVRVHLKRGKPGKTYSLIEGLDEARYEALATLDGDLQYPPEALPELLTQLGHADVVVGDRRGSYAATDRRRGRTSQLLNLVVGRGLLALDTDLQSGMKVFRREVYGSALLRPGPWSFDLELLATAQENGYRIASAPIEMQARQGGQSKVRMARVGLELGLRALAVRLHLATHTAEEDAAELERIAARKGRTSAPVEQSTRSASDLRAEQIRHYERWLMQDARERAQEAGQTRDEAQRYASAANQVVRRMHKGEEQTFRPFAPHQPHYSALSTFSRSQVSALGVFVLLWLAAVLAYGLNALAVTLGVVTAFYLFDLGITALISLRTLRIRPVSGVSDAVVRGIRQEYWPSYTILCPLYHEAEVASQFAQAMRLLDYPSDRMQVLLLTEEDDQQTRDALLQMRLPAHFTVVTVPDGGPRTKPRACNYGLLQATGDFVVIYDAEDIPDPLQLKKAVLTFAQHGADLACAQASLNFYNPQQNLLTRWFTSEYSLWFDLTLPALQRMKSFLPLGGTSNHFRTRILREVGGWDPFNVTEDCDLGVRLAAYHYRTAMVDSTTYEEANPDIKNWLRQRSRWVKGYMQTYLVYMRNPLGYVREGRLGELFWLQVIVGGKPLTQLLNPLLWLLLAIYAVFHAWLTPVYHVLYPAPVFYASAFCLVFGNFFYVYSYLIGCLNRKQYLLTLWSLLIPLYWALMSVASYLALYQLLTRPHYWEKTKHGLHLAATAAAAAETPRGASRGVTAGAARGGVRGGVRVGQRRRSGAYRAVAWLFQPIAAMPLIGDVVAYVTHEWRVWRRELSQREQRQAWLAPALALPVAPVVDMLSTIMLPSLPITPARPVKAVAEQKLIRETRYLVALNPLTSATRTAAHVRRAPLHWLRDRWLIATLLTAITSSISAFLYYFLQGDTMLYGDADSHMRLARMTFDAVTPGLAQLGDVWLPVPHILMWPFVWSNYLWSTGMAGSFAAMICYVVTGLFVFKTARVLSGNDVAAYIGSLAYLLNPNILYLQSTPLSELALLAAMSVACYAFLVWTRSDEIWHLILTAFCVLVATLTRYEGWSLFFALIALIVIVDLFKRKGVQRIIGEVVLFATPGAFGIGLWLLWNYLLTGNPLFFQNGPYSAANQQQAFIARGQLPTFHNLPVDIITYGADVLTFAGPLLVVLAVIGLVVYLAGMWKRPEGMVALALVAPVALYIVSLYSGQIVLYVPGVTTHVGLKDLFNVRYGASSVVPLAIFIGTLVKRHRLLQIGAIVLILAQTTLTAAGGVITLQDGQSGLSCRPFTANDLFLAEHYTSGRILVDMYANAQATSTFQMLDIPLSNAVNIGSYKIWQAALADPAKYVDWILVTPNDAVSQAIDVNSAEFQASFILVQRDSSGNEVFYKRGLPTLPTRPTPTQLIQRYAQCDPNFATASLQASTGAAHQAVAQVAVPAALTTASPAPFAMATEARARISQWAYTRPGGL